MVLKKINLRNFRCYSKKTQKFNIDLTEIIGPNGSGKTSILEGIYVCLQGKSWRTRLADLLKKGEKFWLAELEFSDDNSGILEKISFGFNFDIKEKQVQYRGEKKKILLDSWRQPVTLFVPEDLNLVAASPARKREYFDRVICQMEGNYNTIINRHKRVLAQRNNLLKTALIEGRVVRREELYPWDLELVKYSVAIMQWRQRLVEILNQNLSEKYRLIAQTGDQIKIWYDNFLGEEIGSEVFKKERSAEKILSEKFLKILEEEFVRDARMGTTGVSANRDNFEFWFNGRPADGSASRGETRSMVLALKFVENEEIARVSGKCPVVLLDDVCSELDQKRRKSLMENFSNNQVILTGVD